MESVPAVSTRSSVSGSGCPTGLLFGKKTTDGENQERYKSLHLL